MYENVEYLTIIFTVSVGHQLVVHTVGWFTSGVWHLAKRTCGLCREHRRVCVKDFLSRSSSLVKSDEAARFPNTVWKRCVTSQSVFLRSKGTRWVGIVAHILLVWLDGSTSPAGCCFSTEGSFSLLFHYFSGSQLDQLHICQPLPSVG